MLDTVPTESMSREDFFNMLFMLLRTKKQTFKHLCVFNKESKDYCYCFEGIIALALGGEPLYYNIMELPQDICVIKSEERQELIQHTNVFTDILYPHLYDKYLPETVKSTYLIKLRDKLKLTKTQLDKLYTKTSTDTWDWWDLNDYLQLNFIQFKLLLREIYNDVHS